VLIVIKPEELEEEVRELWKQRSLSKPSIDYATNSLNCWLNEKEIVIFNFDKYGFINDNRRNFYEISVGSAGILIDITKT